MLRHTVFVGALALLLWPKSLIAADTSPAELVHIQRGTLPIILTAPHGGQAAIPGVTIRSTENKGKDAWRYNTGRDAETDKIALGIAAEIKAITGKDVYLVVARFDRKYLDANRPPEIAFDQSAARPAYDYYHRAIRGFIDEVRANHPNGLLIDIHGQHKIPDSLARGTINGKSVTNLIKRGGFEAITGTKGMFGLLASNGFKVFPSNALPPEDKHEDGGFNGGHTTNFYGSHRVDGIDAMQFEFGVDYRKRGTLDSTIKHAAQSIVAFYEAYLLH